MRLAGLPLLQAEIVMMELCKAIVRIPAPAVTMETILSEGSTSVCRNRPGDATAEMRKDMRSPRRVVRGRNRANTGVGDAVRMAARRRCAIFGMTARGRAFISWTFENKRLYPEYFLCHDTLFPKQGCNVGMDSGAGCACGYKGGVGVYWDTGGGVCTVHPPYVDALSSQHQCHSLLRRGVGYRHMRVERSTFSEGGAVS